MVPTTCPPCSVVDHGPRQEPIDRPHRGRGQTHQPGTFERAWARRGDLSNIRGRFDIRESRPELPRRCGTEFTLRLVRIFTEPL
jgi:hypothetical protein